MLHVLWLKSFLVDDSNERGVVLVDRFRGNIYLIPIGYVHRGTVPADWENSRTDRDDGLYVAGPSGCWVRSFAWCPMSDRSNVVDPFIP